MTPEEPLSFVQMAAVPDKAPGPFMSAKSAATGGFMPTGWEWIFCGIGRMIRSPPAIRRQGFPNPAVLSCGGTGYFCASGLGIQHPDDGS